jgi:putative FmdB family regulatory protein
LPIYEYKCANGHVFETVQSMSDDPVTECEVCGAPVERVFHPVAVHFKGSGFYSTDYGSKKKGSADGAKEKESSKADSSSDSGSKSKDSKTESKSKATSASSDD